MAESFNSGSDAAFNRSAARQLAVLGVAIVVGLAGLMWGLNLLASLTTTAGGAPPAVDVANNAITVMLTEEPPQLDSSRSTDQVSGVVLGHVMEGLLRYDNQGELAPGMAEQWRVDELGATFRLRADGRWSDGQPVTAHDFVFAWQLALDPENASEYAFILYPIKNAEAVNRGELPVTELGVRALDARTLEVAFERPIAFFDKLTAFSTYFPVREDFYRATEGRYGAEADQLLYNGPFALSGWVHGQSLQLDRNPYYWDQERIRLDRINVGYITSDPNTRLNLFKDEKIVMTGLTAENLTNALEQRWHIHRHMDGSVSTSISITARNG